MDGERPRSELPHGVAETLEGALERLSASEGTWELWVRADDLRIRKFRLTQEGGRDVLADVDGKGGTDGDHHQDEG